MSVYTPITADELQGFLNGFDLPPLTHFEGVEAGVENTTYFLTAGREWVLQIFEEQGFDEVPFFVELNKRLGDASVPVAIPVADRTGKRLHLLKNKPAVLFPKLVGRAPMTPNDRQRAALGTAVGQMHNASQSMPDMTKDNHRWRQWWEGNRDRVQPFLDDAGRALLDQQIADTAAWLDSAGDLPSGIIHGDLFRDNSLFDGDEIAGIIDFYNACTGYFAFDLAVTLNDWCSNAEGELIAGARDAMMDAYQAIRPLTPAELACWDLILQTAALRFWMLRLVALARRAEGGPDAPPHVKDPKAFELILRARRAGR
ncbi:homoserine kinase [Litorivicinus lipolyticus]|uniref:Homoserine kinase n=1 Tax=Litorivicinus lipolyticus TaxID=418701 RepID=A0A5Q2QAD9_9GAMM|nr:homoserine kinase [Litorivicinus lipolyticus]QGG79182.1 homoserine kinase [Litorivicinus lipolyticus]